MGTNSKVSYIFLLVVIDSYLLSTTILNDNTKCTIFYSRYRTIKLSTIAPRNTIKIDKNIGFIKDREKTLTSEEVKNISEKFNLNITPKCIKIIYKNLKNTPNNTLSIKTLIVSINKYLKDRGNLNRVINLQLLGKYILDNFNYKITSLQQTENNIYEVRILHNSKEDKLKVILKIAAPTLIAKRNIHKNSILTRKSFTIKYLDENKNNFTLKDWQARRLPMIITTTISKGKVIEKNYVNTAPKFAKKIIGIFNCKKFIITKELQLKKIYKEHLILEDRIGKKEYVAIPITENKAIIKNIGCKDNE